MSHIKPYTLDKKYKVYVDGIVIMSYDNLPLAIKCCRVVKGHLEPIIVPH